MWLLEVWPRNAPNDGCASVAGVLYHWIMSKAPAAPEDAPVLDLAIWEHLGRGPDNLSGHRVHGKLAQLAVAVRARRRFGCRTTHSLVWLVLVGARPLRQERSGSNPSQSSRKILGAARFSIVMQDEPPKYAPNPHVDQSVDGFAAPPWLPDRLTTVYPLTLCRFHVWDCPRSPSGQSARSGLNVNSFGRIPVSRQG